MSDAEGSTTNKERRGCGTSSSRSLGHGKEKVCGCVGKTRPAAPSRRPRSAGSAAELDFHQQGVYVRMSRSRKKTPVGSILVCGWTEKEDKKSWHRKLRARDRRRLGDLVRKHGQGDVEELFGNFLATLPEDVSNPWVMRKEWRVRWTRDRFDTELEYLRWIRK